GTTRRARDRRADRRAPHRLAETGEGGPGGTRPTTGTPGGTVGARELVQPDGHQYRAALRRSPAAGRMGQPRPPHARRGDPGDGRGTRGRTRLLRRVSPGSPRTGARPLA